jgi:hypothetical protein
MRGIARKMISWLLWRWTADGFSKHGNVVVQDGRKYDFEHLPHTEAAWSLWERQDHKKRKGDGLTHEHSVMREVLARHVVHVEPTVAGVESLLTQHCVAAIVDHETDVRLRSRDKGWSQRPCPLCAPQSDRWARYRGDPDTWNQLVYRGPHGSTLRFADREPD